MPENNNLKELKRELVLEIKKRVTDKIIEKSNADLLEKLINQAETETEAMNIASLGTTYKRTGFHFDKRLERISNNIKYKIKNKDLSFVNDVSRPTHELIIGDNYDALQNLLITHKGKINVIYIDPPYGKDNMGDFASTNYDNSITRDNLLSMLYPRLLMAKRLLTPEGVIFCSIDDRNQAYVKCLFDEVFGEENFCGQYMWYKSETPPNLSFKIKKNLEYIMCYERNKTATKYRGISKTSGSDDPFTKPQNSMKVLSFPPKTIIFKGRDKVIEPGVYGTKKFPNELLNQLIIENRLNKNEVSFKNRFIWLQNTLIEKIKAGLVINLSRSLVLSYKKSSYDPEVPPNLIDISVGVETTENAGKVLMDILCEESFKYPKDISLIEYLIDFIGKKDSIILDFFAGSGTTGQAVMELNKEDGGNRTFILCTNNEVTETNPKGIAYDVTAKRLKRVMSGKCYDNTTDFPWLNNHEPYMDNLNVYEITEVSKTDKQKGYTAFDKIDESCYGLPKFAKLTDKIAWICSNFENATKFIEK